MSKIVMITGATSGFGKAMAEKFAAAGNDIIITGRRMERLESLQHDLCNKYNTAVRILSFDIRNRAACFDAVDSLGEKWQQVDILINNAGLAAGRDYFDEALLDDWDTMIDTNLKGLLYVTKAVLPAMIKRKKGHIINIGSTAGKEVYEKGNTYCATKFSVNAISQAMRIDLLRHGIKVTAIHPGAAVTEFSIVRFKGNIEAADSVYEGFQPLKAEDVADLAFYCSNLPDHVCVNDLVVTCTAQANSFYLHKEL